MKKINRDGIRALIVETLEEISLGEAKEKEIEEAEDMSQADADAQLDAAMKSLSPEEKADIDAAHNETAAHIAANTMNPDVPTMEVAEFLEKFKEAGRIAVANLNLKSTASTEMAINAVKNLVNDLQSTLPKKSDK